MMEGRVNQSCNPLRDRIQKCPVGHVRSFQFAAKKIDKVNIDETVTKKRMNPVTSKFNRKVNTVLDFGV